MTVRPHILTIAGAPAALIVLARFVDEFDRGIVPSTEATASVAAAFRKILEQGMAADLALNIRKGRGRPLRSFLATLKRNAPLFAFLEGELDAHPHPPPRGVKAKILQRASERFHLGVTHIEKLWRLPAMLYGMNRETGFIRRWVTPEEFARWGNRSARPALRLARKRAAKANNK